MNNRAPSTEHRAPAVETPPTQGVNSATHVWVRFPVKRELLPDLKLMAAERRTLLGDWFNQILENEIIDYRHAQQLLADNEQSASDPQLRAQLRREELLPSPSFRRREPRPELVTGDPAPGWPASGGKPNG